MQKIRTKFTVYFEEPFWVGVYERICGNQYQAGKVTSGAEPKDYQVYSFLRENWKNLQLSEPVYTEDFPEKRMNPKRMRRAIAKSLHNKGAGTKAKQALKLQQEQRKTESQKSKIQKRNQRKEECFALRQKKKKEKHRGH